jgi:hypothetical protein
MKGPPNIVFFTKNILKKTVDIRLKYLYNVHEFVLKTTLLTIYGLYIIDGLKYIVLLKASEEWKG